MLQMSLLMAQNKALAKTGPYCDYVACDWHQTSTTLISSMEVSKRSRLPAWFHQKHGFIGSDVLDTNDKANALAISVGHHQAEGLSL